MGSSGARAPPEAVMNVEFVINVFVPTLIPVAAGYALRIQVAALFPAGFGRLGLGAGGAPGHRGAEGGGELQELTAVQVRHDGPSPLGDGHCVGKLDLSDGRGVCLKYRNAARS